MADDPWTALLRAYLAPWHRLLGDCPQPPAGGLDVLAQQAVDNGQQIEIRIGGWPVQEDGQDG